MEKYGFVYIWYDRKHKRFYIGCRWGNICDGYICSSSWMKQAYNHRPQDFKRRILKTNISDRKELLEQEYHYLKQIKEEELGVKYYNINNHHFGHWSTNENSKLTVGQKISASPNRSANIAKANIGRKASDETKKKMSEARRKRITSEETKQKMSESMKGKNCRPLTEETKQKLREANLGKVRGPHSEETKQRISDSQKGKIISDESRLNMSKAHIGKSRGPMTEEHKEKIRRANLGKNSRPMSEETKQKLREANLGKTLSIEHKEKLSFSAKNRKLKKGT